MFAVGIILFAAGVISVRGGYNKCSRGNTWNKPPAMDQLDYSISLKYGIMAVLILELCPKFTKSPNLNPRQSFPLYSMDVCLCNIVYN